VVYYEFILLNVMLFLAWLSAPNRGFPWFLPILVITAIPVVIFYMREVYNEFRSL